MIILITGGQRSGKSMFAEDLALRISPSPIYIATARIRDDDFRRRVEIHQLRRGNEWTTIEQPLFIGDIDIPDNSTVLVDCLTLLATNWFFECGESIEESRRRLYGQLEALFSNNANYIIVSNEIGLGGVSENALQRSFTDLQGDINKFVSSMADEVYFVVSGIPVKIK